MTTNSRSPRLNKKQLWYLATIFGFSIGFAAGCMVVWSTQSLPLKETFFWVYMVSGASLGMALCQWVILRQIHRYAFLWIPVTTLGPIASIVGILSITASIIAFLPEFSPYAPNKVLILGLVALAAPIIILLGPFCQWLIIQSIAKGPALKEIFKISMGWISAIVILGIMFYFALLAIGTIPDRDSGLMFVYVFIGMLSAMPSGFIFAWASSAAIRISEPI